MSGEKRQYVRVEDRELRRLREQDSRLRSLQRDLPEPLQAVREQARGEFQQRLAPFVRWLRLGTSSGGGASNLAPGGQKPGFFCL